MKKFAFATAAAVLAFASTASAHDWSGVYIGGHIGGTATKMPAIPTCNWAGVEYFDANSDFQITGLTDEGGSPVSVDCNTMDDRYIEIMVADFGYWGGWGPVYDLDNDYIMNWWTEYADSSRGSDYGLHAGINRQFGNIVLGAESSISKAEGTYRYSYTEWQYHRDYYWHSGANEYFVDDYVGTFDFEAEDELDWIAKVVGRSGVAFGPEGKILAYGLAGGAVVKVKNTFDTHYWADDYCNDCGVSAPSNAGDFYQTGYAVGGGVEFAANDHISIGFEYTFIGLTGQKDQSATFYGDDGRSFELTRKAGFENIQTVNAKVNFKF